MSTDFVSRANHPDDTRENPETGVRECHYCGTPVHPSDIHIVSPKRFKCEHLGSGSGESLNSFWGNYLLMRGR